MLPAGLASIIPSFNFTLQGYVNILDIIEAEADIRISTKGLHIYIQGSLFKLFTATLTIHANYGLTGSPFFRAVGSFKNDLFERLRALVEEAFNDAKDAVNNVRMGAIRLVTGVGAR